MKILWLTPTPCGANEILDPQAVFGGWLESLESEIVKNNIVDLHVAFYWNQKINCFKHNGVKYYPIYRRNTGNKLQRWYKRLLFKNNDESELKKIIELVQDIKPELIHVHGTEENFGLITLNLKIPVVVSIQGLLMPYLLKYFSGISKIELIRFESLKHFLFLNTFWYSYLKMQFNSKREKYILENCRHILGRTLWDYRITRLISPHSNYYLSDEILRSEFYDSIWNYPTEVEFTIISVISNRLYKGLETIYSTSLLLNKFGVNHKWNVVGIENNDNFNRLMIKKFKSNIKEHSVNILGKMKPKELIESMKLSHVFCQVSHIENSSNSLCEAMLLGMPIVATFAGGTDTILENNLEGYLFQGGDYLSLAGIIRELYKNPNKSMEIGKKARQRALFRHDSKRIGDGVIKIYRSVGG